MRVYTRVFGKYCPSKNVVHHIIPVQKVRFGSDSARY